MRKVYAAIICIVLLVIFFQSAHSPNPQLLQSLQSQISPSTPTPKIRTQTSVSPTQPSSTFPLAMTSLQNRSYLGSDIKIEQTLPDGNNYHQYLVSYQSEQLTIYGLLTVPTGIKPAGGWPAILFNHGYISPDAYQTAPSSGEYTSYVAALASQGYIVFKPDYRGNGKSQGDPEQPYISANYIIDDMNALTSLSKYKDADPNNIGVWAHSMGGNITLHTLELSKNIKAAVIWSGVVGSYADLWTWWQHRMDTNSIVGNDMKTYYAVQQMIKDHGTPQTNPSFWQSIDTINYTDNITAPVQLDVGTADQVVPPSFSINLADRLKQQGKNVEIYQYPDNDHNLSQSFDEAMKNTVNFFNRYLKSS